jgi:hypothetical protein
VGQGDRPHQAGVLPDQLLHVVGVVAEHAIGGPLARQRRGADVPRVARVLRPVALLLLDEVRHLQRVDEVAPAQLLGVAGPVEDHVDEPLAPVLGQVEAEALELALARASGSRHAHHRGLLRLGPAEPEELHAEAAAPAAPG